MQYSFWAFFKAVALFAVALSMLPATLFAQNKKRDTVVVRHLEESRITSVAKPSPTLQSAPVQVMDRTAIERLGVQELHEAVKNLAGVNIRDYGGIGGIKTVSIRSLSSAYGSLLRWHCGIRTHRAASGHRKVFAG